MGWLLRLGGLGLKRLAWLRLVFVVADIVVVGIGRAEIVAVGVDRAADGFAPSVGAEGVDVFVLGNVDGLHQGLDHVGDGAREFGFYIAADHGGD